MAGEFIEQHDVVIDATADDSVANMLAIEAQDLGKPIVSAYLANQGRSKVVEVVTGPTSGWASTTDMEPIGPEAYESGCGDPVSPTPLYEVQAVAATAARPTTFSCAQRSSPRPTGYSPRWTVTKELSGFAPWLERVPRGREGVSSHGAPTTPRSHRRCTRC